MMYKYFIFDTNALVSAILSPHSTNAQAIISAEKMGVIIYSSETFLEFCEVIMRKKFDKYFTKEYRNELIDRTLLRFTRIETSIVITDCRDPKDNKFLELAVTAQASCIITGDDDLLVLNPFREIPILNAHDFLNIYSHLGT